MRKNEIYRRLWNQTQFQPIFKFWEYRIQIKWNVKRKLGICFFLWWRIYFVKSIFITCCENWIKRNAKRNFKLSFSFRNKNVNFSRGRKFFVDSLTCYLPMYGRERIVWGVKFLKWGFWWDYSFWSHLKPKITLLAFGLCVCYQHNSRTNYSNNMIFGILHFYHR